MPTPEAEALAVRPASSSALSTELAPDVERARSYATEARAKNTRRAYATEWRSFLKWTKARHLEAMPAAGETVALYLAYLADKPRKAAGISLALTAISQAHKVAGLDSPRESRAVKEVWKGIRRTLGTAQEGKAPLLVDALRAIVVKLPDALAGKRDRALLVLGFAGAFRRSELVALDVEDIALGSKNMKATIRRSKTDQEGKGHTLGIPAGANAETCPVRVVQAWIEATGRTAGPLFVSISKHGKQGARLTGGDVARIVKRSAKLAGIDPKDLSGHSLRAGLATQAVMAGKSELQVMKQTRHKSIAVFRKYVRDADLFRDNAADGIGL